MRVPSGLSRRVLTISWVPSRFGRFTFKKLGDDMSFQLYSAPVGGGEATQLTKATDIAGSKHIILAWSE